MKLRQARRRKPGSHWEQVKTETARCLSCGAAKVDQKICIGCGLCTVQCKFDAIHLDKVQEVWEFRIKEIGFDESL